MSLGRRNSADGIGGEDTIFILFEGEWSRLVAAFLPI